MIDRYDMSEFWSNDESGHFVKYFDHQKTLDKIRTIIENADSYGGIGDIKSYILGVIDE